MVMNVLALTQLDATFMSVQQTCGDNLQLVSLANCVCVCVWVHS